MELKDFQKDVLGDLERFLQLLGEKDNIREAYTAFWDEKGVLVGPCGMSAYKMSIKGVPQVCLKVPTGGGKTFLAVNSIAAIFDAMPYVRRKMVVWLVPSDAILRQTVKAFSSREHPYRQRLELDFGSRVEVYTKEMLLSGQNFSPLTVDENLSVCVLTYDSFRTSRKDGRKAFQENGNLTAFRDYYGTAENLPEADETALIQVIRNLNPVVIVDESHHATSKLSIEMLRNFNPSFVLELTATPKSSSNIISIVDARKLKKEQMVKLPVIVYNRNSQEEVYLSAIALRRRLEEMALESRKTGGRYIRPIVLLQAQPRTGAEAKTFEKIKNALIAAGIPGEHIAIKTGVKDEIRDMDLMSEDCPIRYIITVNALKEGWDCPFAYILATVANRSSVVDVEQILGRILRMPYAKAGREEPLNLSYAITSSADFYAALDKVVAGLVNVGFSRRDHRIAGETETVTMADPEKVPMAGSESKQIAGLEKYAQAQFALGMDGGNFMSGISDAGAAGNKEEAPGRSVNKTADRGWGGMLAEEMMAAAEKENRFYWEQVNDKTDDPQSAMPAEVRDKMRSFSVRREFRSEAERLVIPQFMRDDGITYFNETGHRFLMREDLDRGFTLRDKDTMIDFGSLETSIAKVDLDRGDEALPRAFRIYGFENEEIRKWFETRPAESRRRICRDIIIKRLSRKDSIGDADIRDYVSRVMENMSEEALADLERMPEMYAKSIQEKVEELLAMHEAKVFKLMMEQDKIVCEPNYRLPETIAPARTISSIPKSLYEEEDGNLNDYEKKVIFEISSLDNVRWWHRNISKRGFAINGAVTAFPDLIVRTESGKTLMIEMKGDHLDNPMSKAKARAGAEWAGLAGRSYKYYMVFQTRNPGYVGAYSYDDFMRIVREL